jgi:hypothetical protein
MGKIRDRLDNLDRLAMNTEEGTGATLHFGARELETWRRQATDILGRMGNIATLLLEEKPQIAPGYVDEVVWWRDFKKAVGDLVSECRGLWEWALATAPTMTFVANPPSTDTSGAAYADRALSHSKACQAAFDGYGPRRRDVQHARKKLWDLSVFIRDDGAVGAAVSTPEWADAMKSLRATAEAILGDGGERQVAQQPNPPPDTPPVYLTSWREILAALNLKNNSTDQAKVRRLHKKFSSPIKFGGRGKQPFVVKSELLEWWNGLEEQMEESTRRQKDKRESVAENYAHGQRGEKVIPEIAGYERKRKNGRR